MKSTFLILIVLIFLPYTGFCQSLDTITINLNTSVTLEFADDINFIVFGNNPVVSTQGETPIYKYYDIFQQANIVILKVKTLSAPTTTINIRLNNGKLYYGFIKISSTAIPYYNFKTPGAITTINTTTTDPSDTTNVEETKINELLNMSSDLDNVAEIKKNLLFKVTNIVTDEKYYYIKIVIKNNSSNLYEVDGVTFKIEEGKKKSLKKKEISNQNWLSPIKSIFRPDHQIESYSHGFICFVIPLYNASSGNLVIRIIEKNGDRNGNIIVPNENLTNAKVFKK